MKNRPERLICFLVVWLTMFSCISGSGQNISKKRTGTDFKHLCLPGAYAVKQAFTGIRDTVEMGDLDPTWGIILDKSCLQSWNILFLQISIISSQASSVKENGK